jgi:hypothetical protein
VGIELPVDVNCEASSAHVLLFCLQMIGHYKRKWGGGLPLRHTLTIGLGIASALWHMHPSVVHR